MPRPPQSRLDGKCTPMHLRQLSQIPVTGAPATFHVSGDELTDMTFEHRRPPGELSGLIAGQSPSDPSMAIAQHGGGFVCAAPQNGLRLRPGALRQTEDSGLRRGRQQVGEHLVIIRGHYVSIVCLCRPHRQQEKNRRIRRAAWNGYWPNNSLVLMLSGRAPRRRARSGPAIRRMRSRPMAPPAMVIAETTRNTIQLES